MSDGPTHDEAPEGVPEPDMDGLSKPERILVTAQRLFAETGHASLTVDAIAREAGVSRGLLHYYFGSMEDILAQVVQRNAVTSLEAFGHVLRSATSRDDLVTALVSAFRHVLATQPSLYALYYEAFVQSRVHDRVRDELATLFQTRRSTLAEHLRFAEDQGVITLPAGAEVTAGLVIALADGAALQYLSDPSMPVDEVHEASHRLFDALFTG